MAPVAKDVKQQTGAQKKRRKRRKKIKMRILCLKTCWLKTPEDWARFNAWAAKNANPRTLPELEPIVRPSKPLEHLTPRIRILSKPVRRITYQCCTRIISKAALKAKASKRLKLLARPVCRAESEDCEEWMISCAALDYKPSKRILHLAKPRIRPDPEDCGEIGLISLAALKRKPSEKDIELAKPKKYAEDQCREFGAKKEYCPEFSNWMEFLAVPSYRVLKDQTTEMAMKYKEFFLGENETRSKRAYEEQMRKRAAKKRREENFEENQPDATHQTVQFSVEPKDQKVVEKSEKLPKDSSKCKEIFENDPDKLAKRKMEKEAWRYLPGTQCKEFPPKISEFAMAYEATEAIARMAKPKEYKSTTCKDPYKIKESALITEASPHVIELAKPKYKAEPVQRIPPRELDEYGRPIFPKPEYGKKLPKRIPFQEKEKKEENVEKPKKKYIDPLVNAPTIDPIYDPIGAKKQIRARKRAAEEEVMENEDVDAGADENEEKNVETEET